MSGKRRTKEEARKWHDEHLSSHLTSVAKQRAKKKGLPFNITPSDVVVPDKCPLLGIELKRSRVNRGPSDNSPTLDRINPSEGYVRGNVWVISGKANRIKTDASIDEIRSLVRNLDLLQRTFRTDRDSELPEHIEAPKSVFESILISIGLPQDSSVDEFHEEITKLADRYENSKSLLSVLEEDLERLAGVAGRS